MRNIVIVLLVIAGLIAILMLTGVIDISQTEDANLPEITVEEGDMPEFDVDTADVDVGSDTVEVEVPTIDVDAADADDQEAVPAE